MNLVKFTGSSGQPVWVNTNKIEFFRKSDSQTMIEVSSGERLYVKESPEEVQMMLKDADVAYVRVINL
jgi:uncharacterized protein YlzI (FlbEa/FlbD family)